MRKVIITFTCWMLKRIIDKNGYRDDKFCKLTIDNRFVQLTMPNGEVIPCQVDLKLTNGIEDKALCKVWISVIVPIGNISIK